MPTRRCATPRRATCSSASATEAPRAVRSEDRPPAACCSTVLLLGLAFGLRLALSLVRRLLRPDVQLGRLVRARVKAGAHFVALLELFQLSHLGAVAGDRRARGDLHVLFDASRRQDLERPLVLVDLLDRAGKLLARELLVGAGRGLRLVRYALGRRWLVRGSLRRRRSLSGGGALLCCIRTRNGRDKPCCCYSDEKRSHCLPPCCGGKRWVRGGPARSPPRARPPADQAHRRVKLPRLLVRFPLGLALELLGLALGGHLLVIDDLTDSVLHRAGDFLDLALVAPGSLGGLLLGLALELLGLALGLHLLVAEHLASHLLDRPAQFFSGAFAAFALGRHALNLRSDLP